MYWLWVFRHRILNLLLGSLALMATFGMLYILRPYVPHGGKVTAYLLSYIVAYVVILVIFLVRRIPDMWRASGFLMLLYVFSLFAFVSGWLGSGARTFLLCLILLTTILVGPQAGWIAAIVSLATYATFGLIYSQGWLACGPAPVFSDPSVIVMEGIGFSMAVGMVSIGLWFFRVALPAATQANREAHEARTLLAERAQQLDTAHQLLAERTDRLEAANKEVESFSYSVSHDLRSPLRAMDRFSRMLLEDHASHLPAEAPRYLNKLRDNAQRMRQLIDGLLSFSRLGRQALCKRPVLPVDLVHQVLEELADEQAGRQVEVSIGELPPCEADPTLLKQV
jgi:signal transduction histidine kinase